MARLRAYGQICESVLGRLCGECSADELGFDRDDRLLLRNHGACPPVLGALLSGMPQRRVSKGSDEFRNAIPHRSLSKLGG